MKKVSTGCVVVFGLCAVVWSVRVLLDIIYKTYNDSAVLFVLNALVALLWIGAFAVQLRKYRSARDE